MTGEEGSELELHFHKKKERTPESAQEKNGQEKEAGEKQGEGEKV